MLAPIFSQWGCCKVYKPATSLLLICPLLVMMLIVGMADNQQIQFISPASIPPPVSKTQQLRTDLLSIIAENVSRQINLRNLKNYIEHEETYYDAANNLPNLSVKPLTKEDLQRGQAASSKGSKTDKNLKAAKSPTTTPKPQPPKPKPTLPDPTKPRALVLPDKKMGRTNYMCSES